MIKFFRKIRQNLLIAGKTSKYFKYAIGEIVLVVIGILIALSINNWNENRKLKNSKQKLMLALKQEFSINENTLEKRTIGLHKHNAQLNKLVNFSASALELSIDSLKIYASKLVFPIELSMLNSVLEEAVSTGKIEMLSDSLKQKLSLIKDYIKSREAKSKNDADYISNNSKEYTDLLLNLSAIPEVPAFFYVQEPVAMHPDFIKSDQELINLIRSSKTYAILTQIYMASILEEIWIKYGLLGLTSNTIDLIDKELKDE
jgi:hypothetical protein